MLRLLIASCSDVLAKEVARQLGDEYAIKICRSGKKALDIAYKFEPDILLIDTTLEDIDGITVMRTLRGTGKHMGILAISALLEDYVINQLAALQVDFVLSKPCTVNCVVSHIRDIGFCTLYSNDRDRAFGNEVDNILLSLGFRMGPVHYYHTREAILLKYSATEYMLMKWVYLEIAKECGGNTNQVEKAIRDAIRAAWIHGSASIWKMYFPCHQACPTNEEFVSRIATSLRQRTILKPPLEEQQLCVE